MPPKRFFVRASGCNHGKKRPGNSRCRAVPVAEKIRLIHEIDDRPEAELRLRFPQFAELPGESPTPSPVTPEVPSPSPKGQGRVKPASPEVVRTVARGPVETRDADDEFEQKLREITKARRRLFRPLPRGGWVRVLRDRAAIQEFGASSGLLKCGLLPRSLVLCPEILAAKAGILRGTEFSGLLETVKPLMVESWRHLRLPQYNRLAALYRFLQASVAGWVEYSPQAPLAKQLVFFQNV